MVLGSSADYVWECDPRGSLLGRAVRVILVRAYGWDDKERGRRLCAVLIGNLFIIVVVCLLVFAHLHVSIGTCQPEALTAGPDGRERGERLTSEPGTTR